MPPSARVGRYGSWSTPVTSEVVVADEVRLANVQIDGDGVIWSEGRPAEAGRTTLVRRAADGTVTDLLPPEYNARSAVHEYGGGAWWVDGGTVWFANWTDQRLYRLDLANGSPQPLTPEPAVPRGDRYADGALSPDRESIVCVRERHPLDGRGARDVRNELVRLAAHSPSQPEVVVTGPDFVSDPRFSPDGRRLCWIEWDFPNMPWDGTRLRVRDLGTGEDTTVAGGAAESISEPQWQPDGSLTFISDRTGWWNIYRFAPGTGEVEPMVVLDAEVGVPQWVFGLSRYGVLEPGLVVFARCREGFDAIAVRLPDGSIKELGLPYSSVRCLRAAGPRAAVAVVAAPDEDTSIIALELDAAGGLADRRILRPPRRLEDLGVGREYVALPEPVELPSAGGRVAHGLLYRPTNPVFSGPSGELPPLLIDVHGGPTGQAAPELQLELQYFTSRGFAVLAINYGGSTGYGRRYRELLRGAWGVVDVEDTIAAARWAAEHQIADPARICVRGGSAGGYTVLATLARADTPFAVGADYFGVADIEALVHDTHKFESQYELGLVGPYPERRDLYRERSPIEHIDEFSRPLIVLQGLEDAIVPPNQSSMIVDALKAKGVPVAYVAFEGEQHGFRQAANIRRALDSELSFYAQLFEFELPADEGIEPVEIS